MNGVDRGSVLDWADGGLPAVAAGQHTCCNLCGSEESRIVLRAHKRVHAPQHLVIYRRCSRCSFVFLDLDYERWLPTYEALMARASDDELRRYALIEEEETWSVVRDLERVYPAIRTGRGRAMADIGCGAGGGLRVYRSLGWQAMGVECASEPAAFARSSGGFEVKTERYTRASLPEGSLDFLYCYHTLEHLPQPYRALSDFYWHVRPGGLLYVEVPDVKDVNVYTLGFGHVSMFSRRTLRQALDACGFEVLQRFDRSDCPDSFGIGVLCRKPERDGAQGREGAYLPQERLASWWKDSFLTLRWSLWYAFHVGRGRDAVSWRACVGIPWVAAKVVLQRSFPRMFHALRAARDKLPVKISGVRV